MLWPLLITVHSYKIHDSFSFLAFPEGRDNCLHHIVTAIPSATKEELQADFLWESQIDSADPAELFFLPESSRCLQGALHSIYYGIRGGRHEGIVGACLSCAFQQLLVVRNSTLKLHTH